MAADVTWYLAGPMSGIPRCNYPAFEAAAQHLRQRGYHVKSPHESLPNEDGHIPWEQCLRHDVQTVAQCDGIILLPGWTKSRGARLELHIALSTNMPVQYLDTTGDPWILYNIT